MAARIGVSLAPGRRPLIPDAAGIRPHGLTAEAAIDTITITIEYTRIYMSMIARSFTIEPAVDDYIASTKGQRSASERVNELLRRAILQEEYDRLGRQAADFFAHIDRRERRAARSIQHASTRTLSRD